MSALGHKRTFKRLQPMSALKRTSPVAFIMLLVLEAELIAIHFPLARVAYARGKAHNCMMPPLLDFWFDFASTYSYPAAMQIVPVAQQAGVMVRFRPFLLGPLFKAQGWPTSPFNVYPAKGRYMWRDLERICFDFDLPFRQPEPFPQNSLLAARVALIGLSDSWGEEFCRGVFRAQFGEGRQIDDPTVISDILSQLRIESAPVLEAARAEANKAALRTQTEEAKHLGIFGAPSFTTAGGELFWGNDRLERAIAWAKNGD